MKSKNMIVDDEPNILRLIGYSLEAAGYEIVTAKTGAEALKVVALEQPDLIVLDVMLPDMSGMDVCQQLRKNPQTTDLPIIMLSARAQVADKVEGLKAGADEYATKPVDAEEMTARVAALLERREHLVQTLTPTEISICNMVRSGLQSKEIAHMRSVSTATISRHRERIRHKLAIANTDVNLTTYLQTTM